MSEMQTLNIRPEDKDLANKKQVIDEQLKANILHWLINDVRLLKSMNDEQLFDLKVNLP